ncbi:transposase [Chitiniphilus eburneus]|uniref:Transposase n=1 Tax=Chitiniphilus eburneus TaxID=2571148 RepID=A0A4U0Q8W6_9NEIS|nr:transposase [Chitiniphilus eburneus]
MNRPRWIGYPRAHEILSKLEDLVRHPRQTRMPSMLLLGNTNNGKTRLIERFIRQHPVKEDLQNDYVHAPVLFIQTPAAPTEAALYSEILNAFYERVPASSLDAKRDRAMHVLKGVRLKVLLLDELHNMLASNKSQQQQVLNSLKFMSNVLSISIVGCGTGDLARAVSIDPQIQNRFKPLVLPNWRPDEQAYRDLLASFEVVLPLRRPSSLSSNTVAHKINAMTEGTIGEISDLLNLAAKQAIRDGTECITVKELNSCGYVPPSDRKKQIASL